jgi:hypothetical protein
MLALINNCKCSSLESHVGNKMFENVELDCLSLFGMTLVLSFCFIWQRTKERRRNISKKLKIVEVLDSGNHQDILEFVFGKDLMRFFLTKRRG